VAGVSGEVVVGIMADLLSRCTKLGDYGKKVWFAALNWETQAAELHLNRRPAIMSTLRDLSMKK
jgi:hypothetical protein